MKILFLDCDGVLNSRKTPQTDGWPIDPYMAFLVGRIVDRTGCKVVLSSSWRHSKEGQDIVQKKVFIPLYDVTDLGGGCATRGDEIALWLDEHPDVAKYAILDDANDILPEQMENFFKTSFETGLTEEIAERVERHLI